MICLLLSCDLCYLPPITQPGYM